jgi:ribosomal protein S18 acetylase RimI-like enzyme
VAPKTSPPVQIRAARPRDLPACARVCVSAFRDLSRRQGKPPPRIRARDLLPFMRHVLATDPMGFQVAVTKGKIACYAITVLRGKTHFLAQFFALPGVQSRGIGRKVLTRAFEEPKPPRDAVRCLVASLDLRAQSLYLKFGMQPRTIMYYFSGKPTLTGMSSGLKLRQVDLTNRPTKRSMEIAGTFDKKLRGVRRDVDQEFFLSSDRGSRFFEAQDGGRTVGYVVVRGKGGIGPGGVVNASMTGDLLNAAIAKARELALKKVFVWVPGLNRGAIRAAFAAGLKVDFITVWMAAGSIGNLELYLPSGGVLF